MFAQLIIVGLIFVVTVFVLWKYVGNPFVEKLFEDEEKSFIG